MKFILRYNIFLIFILTGIRLLAQNVPEYSGDLKFIENKNQWDKKILFKTEIAGGDLYLEKDGFTYNFLNQEDLVKFKGHNHSHGHEEDISLKNKSLNRRIPIVIRGHAVKLKFLNSNQSSNVSAEKPLDEYNNYYIGKDESKWASKVKIFQNVIYNNLWNNINMKVYSRGPNPKYDFILNPGAKLENIAMKYEGANNVYIRRGNLIIETSVNNITELKPYAYQIIKGQIKVVDCKFILNNTDSVITFSFPEGYDKSKMLVVDPELILATFSGSKSDNWGFSATYDNEGHTYMAGLCFGTQYPVTTGAYQMQFNGGDSLYLWWYNIYYPGVDIAIMKFDSTHAGSQTPVKKIYATYLGGSGEEMPHSLIVNSNNELLVYGTTGSPDFPTTQNAYNRTFKGGTEIILDNVLWFRQGSDIFISKFNADGSKLLASTLIGGTNNDGFNSDKVQNPDWMGDPVDESIYGVLKTNYADEVRGGIMVDENNNVYVVSSTHSKDFPVTANAFQKTFAGGRQDGCVFKMDNNLSALIWSSYLGGTGNDGA
ncbi:MAG: hypothetical protein Q8880_12405, partial [Bacteroidota bacterium]|nr:hypothetical protein [Bacteroidota bacterium]